MTGRSKTFTVVGATSDTGSVVKRLLEDAGHSVRPVARSSGLSLDDVAGLAEAFRVRTAKNTTATTLEQWSRRQLREGVRR